jgi:hypothetical protein
MSIVVECPGCRRRLEAKDEWAGRRIRCPTCGQTVAIPSPAYRVQPPAMTGGSMLDLLEDAAAAAPVVPALERPIAPGVAPEKRRKKRGSNSTQYLILGAAAGCLLTCGGLGVAFLIPAVQGFRAAAARHAAERHAAQQPPPIPDVPTLPPGPGMEPAAPSGPVWAPDPQLVGQLTVNAVFDRYRLRLPADFALTHADSRRNLQDGAVQGWVWMSTPRQNARRRVINVTLIEYYRPPKGVASELEKEIADDVDALRTGAGFEVHLFGVHEKGQIAGKLFLRSRFMCQDGNELLYCTALAAFDGKRVLRIMTTSPEDTETLEYRLLDAATMTFAQQ